jgi:DNA-binding PadR family transcriptional regulator
MISATRLLILGAIRVMQPVHGYEVRRELLSWRLEDLASVRPGSIYGAIRTLERDGCVAVHSRASENSRPERTAYVLTVEGEKEFQLTLREAWWTVRRAAEPLVPALAMMSFLPREEVERALRARVATLEGMLEATGFVRDSIRDDATGADGEIPDHVREILDFVSARDRAEIEWARAFGRRLRAGAYRFTGEKEFPTFGPGRGVPRPAGPGTPVPADGDGPSGEDSEDYHTQA